MNDTICSLVFYNGIIVHKKIRSLTKTLPPLPISMFRNISHLYPHLRLPVLNCIVSKNTDLFSVSEEAEETFTKRCSKSQATRSKFSMKSIVNLIGYNSN